jgi:hypothetical protein
VCRRSAATQGDTDALKMLPDRGPMNVQLGADLSQGPASRVQICYALNVHGAAVRRSSQVASHTGIWIRRSSEVASHTGIWKPRTNVRGAHVEAAGKAGEECRSRWR